MSVMTVPPIRWPVLAALAVATVAGGCAADLAGEWVLEDRISATAEVALRIRHDKVEGTDGCNMFRGRLRPAGSDYVLAGFETTLRACADPVAQAAAGSVQEALPGSRWTLRDCRLTVENEVRELLFVRRKAASASAGC